MLISLRKLLFFAAVVTVVVGIYSAIMNMPIITGCLNAECQLRTMKQAGVNEPVGGDLQDEER